MQQTGRTIEFWYEFASTYSYLSAMRIETLATKAGVGLIWRPFLLGPIFRAQGWSDSPFNLYPAKGRYMRADMQRICKARELSFKMPDIFPANGLLAARVALVGADKGWIAAFTKAVFAAEFGSALDISRADVIADILKAMRQDPEQILQAARSSNIKEQLKRQTENARTIGIFGAPTFVAPDQELFWGDDRLRDALVWPADR